MGIMASMGIQSLARPYTTLMSIPGDPGSDGRRMRLVPVIRTAFFVLILTVTLLNVIEVAKDPNSGAEEIGLSTRWWIPVGAALTLFGLAVAVDVLTPRKKIATLSGVAVGLLAGMVLTVAFSFVIDLIAQTWDIDASSRIVGTTKILVGIVLAYLGITTVLQTQDDFRLVIPYVEFAKQRRGVRPLVLDTSALIDARIVDVAESGVSQSPIVVPQFVVDELQRLADSQDKLKRARGRRGLDVVSKLQRSPKLDVTIDETSVVGKAVDQMLVDLCAALPGVVVTTDTGLARVADIKGVPVVNLNALAHALKPSLIPGELLTVRLVKHGEHTGQGVGYLADGTMVVAEDGAGSVGHDVTLTVTSAIQTANGRMIFGRMGEADAPRSARPAQHQADRGASDAANGGGGLGAGGLGVSGAGAAQAGTPVGASSAGVPVGTPGSDPPDAESHAEIDHSMDDRRSPELPARVGKGDSAAPLRPARPNRARNPRR